MRNLTSANSILTLAAAGLFPVPQVLQGYAVDRAFEAAAITRGDVQMGVDGKLSAGLVLEPAKLDIFLQADSLSIDILEQIDTTEQSTKNKIPVTLTAYVPSVKKLYTFNKGYLVTASVIPNHAKSLQPRSWSFAFESISVANA